MEISGVGEINFRVETKPRSIEVIQKEIDSEQEKLDGICEVARNLYDSMPKNKQEIVNNVGTILYDNGIYVGANYANGDVPKDEITVFNERMAEFSDQKDVFGALQMVKQIFDQENKISALQTEMIPFKVEKINVLAGQILETVDFTKLVDYFFSVKETDAAVSFEDISFLKQMKLTPGSLSENNFFTLDGIEKKLDFIKSNLKKEKLIKNSEVIDEKEKKRFSLKEIEEIKNKLEDNFLLFMVYRSGTNDSGFYRLINTYVKSTRDFFMDERLLESISEKITAMYKQYGEDGLLSQNDDERKKMVESKRGDWKKILNKLKIDGLVAGQGEELLFTSESIKSFLEDNFPSAFLNKVRKIEILNEKPKEDVDLENNDKSEIRTAGCFHPFYKGRNLVCGDITIYEPVVLDSLDNEESKLFKESNFRATLSHEIGHAVHCDLSVDELKSWEEAMKSDNTEITWYVGYSRKRSESAGKKEDFCESFMMFVKDPSLLKILSEKRYEYMKELFIRYIEPDRLNSFKSSLNFNLQLGSFYWDQKGFSVEDIRSLFLSNK